MVLYKFNNVLVVAVFVMMCVHAVRPSTVIKGPAITKRSAQTDHAAAGAAAAGDTIAATGGVISAGALATGPFAPVVAAVGGVTAAVGGLTSIISRAADQSCRDFGCHKNYCWAYCSIGNQWCYTTKSYSQSFEYVNCTKNEDCNGCWKCAGSCTV